MVFVPRYRAALGLPDDASVRRYWLQEWYRHHANVLDFFQAMPQQLLVYDFDRDDARETRAFPVFRLEPRSGVFRPS